MAISIKHAKTDNIAAWTQADLDAQIALGNFPAGTLLNDIVLSTDWNAALNTSMATGNILGRSTASTGPFEEIALGTGLLLAGGTLSASSAPGGSSGDVQFNNSGAFGGDPALFWDNANKRLGIGTASPTDLLHIHQPGFALGDGLKIEDVAGLYAQFYHQAGNGLRMFDTNRFTFDSDVFFLANVTIVNALNLGSGVFNGGANFNGLFGVVDGLYVQDSTGLGTSSPLSKLDVNGNVAIGSGYAATIAAPTDGLIVQGKTGIGVSSPAAQLHLPAGTATVNTAPFKITLGGTLLTTPEAGAIESINSHIYWTDSTGTRYQLDQQTASGLPLLSITAGINAKTVANTNLYTVPTGKTAVITGYVVRCFAATTITVGATAGVGNASGTNNIAPSQAMTALTSPANLFIWPIVGMSVTVTAGNSVFFNLATAATGTSQTLVVDLIGYLF